MRIAIDTRKIFRHLARHEREGYGLVEPAAEAPRPLGSLRIASDFKCVGNTTGKEVEQADDMDNAAF